MAAAPITTTLNPTNEGYILGPSELTFAAARNAATGAGAYNFTTSTPYLYAVYVRWYSQKGTNYWAITRTHFRFDTSSINGTVSSATLKVAGYSLALADIIVTKSTAFNGVGNTLVTSDFGNVDYTRLYSSEVPTWNLNSYNNIALNADAKTDIENENVFRVGLVEHDFDYLNVSTTGNPRSGIWFADGTYPVELSVTYTPSASVNFSINGISALNIGSINGVDAASIAGGNGL